MLLWHSLIFATLSRRTTMTTMTTTTTGRRLSSSPTMSKSSASIDNVVLRRFSSFPRHWRRQYPLLDLRMMVLWTCARFSATAGGGERVSFAAFAPPKTARKRGRDRGKLAAIVFCFDVGCVAPAHSHSSPFSLAEPTPFLKPDALSNSVIQCPSSFRASPTYGRRFSARARGAALTEAAKLTIHQRRSHFGEGEREVLFLYFDYRAIEC